MNLFHKVAAVLEAAANHLDTQEKVASVTPAQTSVEAVVTKVAKSDEHLAEMYEAVTGKTPDAALLAKLATDSDMREAFLKLAEHAASPDSLGGPGERTDQPAEPKTASERVKLAEDRFREWIINS